VANTLAYCDTTTITAVKSFVVQTLGEKEFRKTVACIKLNFILEAMR
jgi:hypothetical protein